jgi:hypothetical protein
MNKVLFLLTFLFYCNISTAQDTLAPAKAAEAASVKYTEDDIYVDSDTIKVKSFDNNFQKKYTEGDFIYEHKQPEKNSWDHFKEWLASIFREWFSLENPQASLDLVVLILKIIAALIIIFVIYLIVKALLGKEGQWIFSRESGKKQIHYTELEKNLHLLDFKKLISESVQAGEKRIAIRYYYLWLLQIMAKNHYIEWDIEKTNSDYLYELKNTAHREEFSYLSYLYNYIWYGEFEIDDKTFEKTEKRFKTSLKTFRNE